MAHDDPKPRAAPGTAVAAAPFLSDDDLRRFLPQLGHALGMIHDLPGHIASEAIPDGARQACVESF